MLHVHAYEGHDHADHHHGPAAHFHGEAAEHQHPDEGTSHDVRFESCNPGAHAVAAAVTCVASISQQAPFGEAVVVVRFTSPPPAPHRVNVSDVRAHSPPRLTDAPLRAPPVVHAA